VFAGGSPVPQPIGFLRLGKAFPFLRSQMGSLRMTWGEDNAPI